MIPAMVTALVGFVAARLAVTFWVRPHLIAPLHLALAVTPASPLAIGETQAGVVVTPTTRGILPGDWPLSIRLMDNAGHAPSQAFLDPCVPFRNGEPPAELPGLHPQHRRQVP